MTRAILVIAGLLGLTLLIAVFSSFYFVNQTEEALVLQFGAPQAVITEPGLHFKTPLTQSVVFFDKRVLLLDAPTEEVIASDKKRMIVDAFARWKIVDPLRFYQTLTDKDGALGQLAPILSSNVRGVLEMTRMIDVTRTYATVSTMLQQQADLRRTAIQQLADVPN